MNILRLPEKVIGNDFILFLFKHKKNQYIEKRQNKDLIYIFDSDLVWGMQLIIKG